MSQLHLAQNFLIARLRAQAGEDRVGFDEGQQKSLALIGFPGASLGPFCKISRKIRLFIRANSSFSKAV
jgi:hypothetical protein